MFIELTGKFWKVIPRSVRTFLSRLIEPTFTSSAAGIITNEEGEVLLLDHVLRPLSGWGIPGGFLEKGEQPEAALRREIMEETSLELGDVRLYRARTLRRHIEIIFTAKAFGDPTVNTSEIRQARWFAIADLPPEMNIDQQFMIRRALGVDKND